MKNNSDSFINDSIDEKNYQTEVASSKMKRYYDSVQTSKPFSYFRSQNIETENMEFILSPADKHTRNVSMQGDFISPKEVTMSRGEYSQFINNSDDLCLSFISNQENAKIGMDNYDEQDSKFNTPWFNDASCGTQIKKRIFEYQEEKVVAKTPNTINKSSFVMPSKRRNQYSMLAKRNSLDQILAQIRYYEANNR